MKAPIRIEDAGDPRIADYRDIRDADLRGREGAFIAEGRGVVRRLLASPRFATRSVLVDDATARALAEELAQLPASLPVMVASRAVIRAVAGFDVHRGCLAVGERGADPGAEALLAAIGERPSTVVLLEDLTNADNVGACFRNARAFGADALLLTARSVDPLYRKAVRVSMGTALELPFSVGGDATSLAAVLARRGYRLWALTPRDDAEDLAALARAGRIPDRVALLVGTEGPGLGEAALAACDRRVRIAMAAGVDSLNVATATGIALHHLARLGRDA